ncbi:hypothetical protein BU17DRAFT_99169 [Hysterangium stoloniferum]|nr:hypothetical protein BU17DRAFT_99169 [Hysterangium stoloniferum]
MIEKHCEEVGAKWKKSKQTVMHAVYAPGCIAKQKQCVNLANAARAIAAWLRGDKLDLTEEEKMKYEEIQASLNKLGGVEQVKQLPKDMKVFLRSKTEELQASKQSGSLTSMRSKSQDAQATLESIGKELNALNQRTGIEGFLFAVKPDHGFNFPAQFIMTEKAGRFLCMGMKKVPTDLLKELELFVVGDIESLVLNHNERLCQIKGKISQEIKTGLFEITGKDMPMQYEQYLKLVADYGVMIRNWPEEVPFTTPSKISSLYQLRILLDSLSLPDSSKWCKWEHLPKDEWKAKQEEYIQAVRNKGPKKRIFVAAEDYDESATNDEPTKKRQKTAKAIRSSPSGEEGNKPMERNSHKKDMKKPREKRGRTAAKNTYLTI